MKAQLFKGLIDFFFPFSKEAILIGFFFGDYWSD